MNVDSFLCPFYAQGHVLNAEVFIEEIEITCIDLGPPDPNNQNKVIIEELCLVIKIRIYFNEEQFVDGEPKESTQFAEWQHVDDIRTGRDKAIIPGMESAMSYPDFPEYDTEVEDLVSILVEELAEEVLQATHDKYDELGGAHTPSVPNPILPGFPGHFP